MAGYAAFLMRLVLPEWASIITANSLFLLGVVIRLDGVSLFVRQKRASRYLYALPLLLAPLLGVLYTIGAGAPLRAAIVSLPIAAVGFSMGAILFTNPNRDERPLSRSMGGMLFFWGFLLLLRSLSWLMNPSGNTFESNYFQVIYHTATLVMEVALGLGLFMINGARLEAELNQANRELDAALKDLKAAMGEIKTLTGILPVCAHCKKIRDEETNSWQRMEEYIANHSNAGFTHGICPECVSAYYPEIKIGKEQP